jgi:HYR domain
VSAFLAGATATDAIDPAPTITNDAPSLFPNGATMVHFTATDASGNAASCSALVTVRDTTPPQLTAFSLNPGTLKPPNHKLINISVPVLSATDACDASPAIRCSVGSSESPNAEGDGNTAVDIIFNGASITTQSTGERLVTTAAGKGSFTLALRAERSGKLNGRTYTTNCAAVDATGNRSATKTSKVVVPK